MEELQPESQPSAQTPALPQEDMKWGQIILDIVETVALALSQYFQVPPENLVTQGYGERFLKIDTQTSERVNRRAAVRNITGLLQNS